MLISNNKQYRQSVTPLDLFFYFKQQMRRIKIRKSMPLLVPGFLASQPVFGNVVPLDYALHLVEKQLVKCMAEAMSTVCIDFFAGPNSYFGLVSVVETILSRISLQKTKMDCNLKFLSYNTSVNYDPQCLILSNYDNYQKYFKYSYQSICFVCFSIIIKIENMKNFQKKKMQLVFNKDNQQNKYEDSVTKKALIRNLSIKNTSSDIQYLIEKHSAATEKMARALIENQNAAMLAMTENQNAAMLAMTKNFLKSFQSFKKTTLQSDQKLILGNQGSQTHTNTSNENMSSNGKSELRFESIQVPIPQSISQDSEERKQDIVIWMGKVLKKVFQVGFINFKAGEIDQKKLKTFCSENIIRNMIKFSHVHMITPEEMQFCDEALTKDLLWYFKQKYPETEQAQTNSQFEKLLIQRDLLNQNEYDYIHKSGIKFAYKQSGNYNKEIMQFINYLAKKLYSKFEQQAKNDKKDKNNSKENDKESGATKSISKHFHADMQKIFKMIEQEDQVAIMNKYIPKSSLNTEKLQQQIQNSYKNNDINDSDKQKYRQKVRSYTQSAIGKKLEQNQQIFSSYEINSENLKLKTSALMRIITKWCEELQKCYDQKQFMSREYPFRMQNGQEKYLDYQKMFYLNYLLQRQKRTIDQFLSQITKNNYEFQSKQLKAPTNDKLKMFSENEAMVAEFNLSIFKNNKTYLVTYLNLLIQGINNACKNFHEYMCCVLEGLNNIKNHIYNCVPNQAFAAVNRNVKYKEIQVKPIPEHVPDLITFRIGDLLRCKCSSKETEIIALYKEAERISALRPQQFKIIRVKNRLSKGNKDILMNILYKDSVIVEMQLAIKQDKTKFIECSNKFNHYFYELIRAKFGAIMEMCSIWMSQDPRAEFYTNKIQAINQRKFNPETPYFKPENKKKCCKVNSYKKVPFVCDSCQYHYSESALQNDHRYCRQCNIYTCFQCQFQSCQQIQEKLQLLPNLKENQYFNSQDISFPNKIPQVGGIIADLISKKKKVTTFYTIKQNGKYYLFQYEKQTNKVRPIAVFDNQNFSHGFLQENIVCTSQNIQKEITTQQKQQDRLIQEEQQNQYQNIKFLVNQYFVIKYLKQNFKAQKESLSLIKHNIVENMFDIKQTPSWPQVKKINLSQNQSLRSIQKIVQKFPNVQAAVLNNVGLRVIPDKMWPKLIYLDLTRNNLKTLNNLSQCKVLKTLIIKKNRFEKINEEAFKNLKQIVHIDLEQNDELRSLPQSFCNMTTLKSINLCSLHQLQALPQDFGKLKSLQTLLMKDCSNLQFLPQSFSNLASLKTFVLVSKYVSIKTLPKSFGKLSSLQTLNFGGSWYHLEALPQSFGNLTSLKNFCLQGCRIDSLPQSFGNLSSLQNLQLNYIPNIKSLPKSFSNLKSLKTLNLIGFEHLEMLPQSFGNLSSLQSLTLKCQQIKELSQSFGNLNSLKNLMFQDCKSLQTVPQSFGQLKSLQKLCFIRCNMLKFLPQSFGALQKLIQLKFQQNEKLQALPQQFSGLFTLQDLTIRKCKNLTELSQNFGHLNSLKILAIQDNQNLKMLPESFRELSSLEELTIKSGQNIQNLQQLIGSLTSLKKLSLQQWKEVAEEAVEESPKQPQDQQGQQSNKDMMTQSSLYKLLESLCTIQSLKELSITKCRDLQALPQSIGSLTSLKKLILSQCQFIRALPQSFGNLCSLQTLHIQSLQRLKKLPKSFCELQSLEELTITLPQSIGNLAFLKKFALLSCRNIKKLPQSFGSLRYLQNLDLYSCYGLQSLPDSFGDLEFLTSVRIYNTSIQTVSGFIFSKSIHLKQFIVEINIMTKEQQKILQQKGLFDPHYMEFEQC